MSIILDTIADKLLNKPYNSLTTKEKWDVIYKLQDICKEILTYIKEEKEEEEKKK